MFRKWIQFVVLCTSSGFYYTKVSGDLAAVFSKTTQNSRLSNAMEQGKVVTAEKETYCVHLCILQYQTTGRCSSVNYNEATSDCELNDLHMRDDENNVALNGETPWNWINLEIGPPIAPSLEVMAETGSTISFRWNASWNGGFNQTFRIEYKKESEDSFTLLEDELYDEGVGVMIEDSISNLQAGTSYVIRVTASNSRPYGVNESYSEVTVTTSYPTSCSGYKNGGFLDSGNYVIDPDGTNNGVDSFTVYCDLSKSPPNAIFHHDKEDLITLANGPSNPGLAFTVSYGATMDQIALVANAAAQCSQSLKRRCNGAATFYSNTRYSYWFGRSNVQRNYWADSATEGCWCNKLGTCNTGVTCNCDVNSQEWNVDEGDITTKEDLPMVKFYQGDIDGAGEVTEITLGPLVCSN